MSRTSFAVMSLIAAIPAAILGVFLVIGFLQHASDMPMVLLVVAGIALLASAFVALTPVGILVSGRPRGQRTAKPAKAAVAEPEAEEKVSAKKAAGDEPASSSEADEWADSAEEEAAASDAWEMEESEVAVSEADADEFEFDDNLSDEFDSEFDFDEDENR